MASVKKKQRKNGSFFYEIFELDEENSFPEELEQKYFGLSDEYNPDDFESDEFEDATEDSWDGGYQG